MARKSPNLGSKPCSITPGGFLTGAVKLWDSGHRDPPGIPMLLLKLEPPTGCNVALFHPYKLQTSDDTLVVNPVLVYVCIYFWSWNHTWAQLFLSIPWFFPHRCRGRRRGVPLWIEFNCLISPVLRRAMAASIGWMLLGGSWRLMETYGDIWRHGGSVCF